MTGWRIRNWTRPDLRVYRFGMSDTFLDKVYGLKGPEATRDLYDAWSSSYDAEVQDNGYATPARVAEALRAHSPDPDRAILDFGCGTGLSGMALRAAGFTRIDGVDISRDMMARAPAGLYRALDQIAPGEIVKDTTTDYAAIAAIGVVGAGAAPLEVLDGLLGALTPGGLLGFSFNDHTLADPAYEARIDSYLERGLALLRFKEYGPHLPGRDMKSNVYILEKA